MGNFTTAVDFGSSKIAVAVGQKTASGIKIVFYSEAQTSGIRAGEIINDKKVCDALMSLVRKAESECGESIESAVIAISDKFLKSMDVKAHSERKDYDKFIDADEIRNLSAQQIDKTIDEDDMIFEAIPQKFDVDDQIGLKLDDVIGMKGTSIDGFFKIFYGKKSNLERRRGILKECGLKMDKAILSPVASARAVLNDQEMENGVALVDIGKGLTEIAIVKDRIVREVATIPFGGEAISNDIKNVTGITYDWAECLKKRYGSALEEYTPENKLLVMHGNDNIEEGTVEISLLSRIIEARVSEIFDAVAYFISESGYEKKIPSGVVITGGTAYMEHIKPLAKSLLGCRVRLAAPHGSTMDSAIAASDTTAATAVGLVFEAIDHKLSYAKECKVRTAPAPTPVPTPAPAPAAASEGKSKSQSSNPLRRIGSLFDFGGGDSQPKKEKTPEEIELENELARKHADEAAEIAEAERLRKEEKKEEEKRKKEEEKRKKEEEKRKKEEEKKKKEGEKAQKEREKFKGLSGFIGGLFDEPNNEA